MQAIHSIRQGDRDLPTHFIDLQIQWQELEVLRPIFECQCTVKCSFLLAKSVKKYREWEYVTCFLKGLNEQYDTVRRQILCMEPLPSVAKAYSMIQQQERNSSIEMQDGKFVHNVSTNSWKSNIKNKCKSMTNPCHPPNHNFGKICSFCGKENHKVETYFFTHGFSANFKFKSK
jgi:hypothetical protein